MKATIFAVLFVLALTAPVRAGFDEGVAAIERGDYAVALRELRPLAEQGHARSQFRLGRMYRAGVGVPRDAAEAAKWSHRAAEQGDPLAQYDLGMFYATGQGVSQDFVQAHVWFNLAAMKDEAALRVSKRAAKARELIAKEMTPTDVSMAQRLAREWLEAHPTAE
jgi:TPR repeat protein